MATPGVHSRLVVLLSLGGCCGLVLGRATPWHLSLSTGQAPDEDPQRKQPDTPFASLCLSFIPHEPALGPLVGVPGGDVSGSPQATSRALPPDVLPGALQPGLPSQRRRRGRVGPHQVCPGDAHRCVRAGHVRGWGTKNSVQQSSWSCLCTWRE